MLTSSWGGFGTLGTTVGAEIARDADLIFCVGTRLTDFDTGSHSAFQNPDAKFITVNVCGRDAYKMGAFAILADAREGLRALFQEASARNIKPDPDYLKVVSSLKDQWREKVRTEILDPPTELITRGKIVFTINKQAQQGDTITSAAGTPIGDLHQLWDATGGRNCHLEFGYSCMGYEIPAGLGIRMKQNDGEVYVLVGDGTYLMNPTDLVTALQHDLKITVILVENHGFQSIHGHQKVLTGHGFGTEFRYRDDKTKRLEGAFIALDFAKNAESMGAKTWNVKSADELTQALHEARQERQSCVIVAETDRHSSPPSAGIFWDFTVPEVSQDTKTQELRRAYKENIAELQRFYY